MSKAQIIDYISYSDLSHYKNHIDCICILCTGDELENGFFDRLIDQIESTSQNSKNLLLNVDLKIIIGNTKCEPQFKKIESYFRNIEVIQIYVPTMLDVYYDSEHEIIAGNVPKLGLKSGPNYVFFEVIKTLEKYNTTLMLECDIFLSNDWFREINGYTNNSNGFWISGSLYYGKNNLDIHHILNTHINGGVCLYATGCKHLQKFMSFCREKLIEYVALGTINLPYDMSIKMSIDQASKHGEEGEIMGFIKSQYVSNKLILNYSAKQDKKENEHKLYKLYNYSILHKKQN